MLFLAFQKNDLRRICAFVYSCPIATLANACGDEITSDYYIFSAAGRVKD